MPFPKAALRKKNGARNPQKTRIPTDTTESQLSAAQQNDQNRKRASKVSDSKISRDQKINKAGGQNKRVDAKNKNHEANTKLWQQTECRLNDSGDESAAQRRRVTQYNKWLPADALTYLLT